VAAVLASLTAFFYGLADFAGGLGSKRHPAWTVVAGSQIMGLPVLILAMFIWPPDVWSWRDFLIGGFGGYLGLVGLSLLYFALARGTMAVIAPVTGVVYLLVGLIVDLFGGSRLTSFQWTGMVLAAIAVLLIGGSRTRGAADKKLLGAAAGAGLGFGTLNVIFSMTDAASGLTPILGARAFSIPFAVAVVLLRGDSLKILGPGRWLIIAAGALDVGANVSLLTALHMGTLSIVNAISGMYPAVTAVVALLVLKERLTPRQSSGVATALLAVAFLAGVFG
jgi:drug/metabolite transporter (DMT)-like permease